MTPDPIIAVHAEVAMGRILKSALIVMVLGFITGQVIQAKLQKR